MEKSMQTLGGVLLQDLMIALLLVFPYIIITR